MDRNHRADGPIGSGLLRAAGVRRSAGPPSGDAEAMAEFQQAIEQEDPAAAYAWLATGRVLVTTANMHLVDGARVERWRSARGALRSILAR